jgi:hypothetical protein
MGIVRAFHSQTDYLVLPREHFEQISQAIDRQAGPADGTAADRLDRRTCGTASTASNPRDQMA